MSVDTADRRGSVAIASRIEEAASKFAAEGYGIVRGLFSPAEIAELDEDARRLLSRTDLIDMNNLRCRWQQDVETDACVFDCFDPVTDLSPAVDRLARDSRIEQLVAAVYGEPGHLFKDKLIFKPPGASGYAMHQDYIAWPTFPRSFLTVVVPIDAADKMSGCIQVFPGYHDRGCLTPEDGDYHELPAGSVDEVCAVDLCLEPGDVAFFGGFMPHRSAPNRSRSSRRQLYLSYNAHSELGDYRTQHYVEFERWLREQYAKYGRNEVYFK
jgi:2-aminoethylphosphonate dioxygenase